MDGGREGGFNYHHLGGLSDSSRGTPFTNRKMLFWDVFVWNEFHAKVNYIILLISPSLLPPFRLSPFPLDYPPSFITRPDRRPRRKGGIEDRRAQGRGERTRLLITRTYRFMQFWAHGGSETQQIYKIWGHGGHQPYNFLKF